jgi:hypothetical protein
MEFRNLNFTKQDYLETLVNLVEEDGFTLAEAIRICDRIADKRTYVR